MPNLLCVNALIAARGSGPRGTPLSQVIEQIAPSHGPERSGTLPAGTAGAHLAGAVQELLELGLVALKLDDGRDVSAEALATTKYAYTPGFSYDLCAFLQDHGEDRVRLVVSPILHKLQGVLGFSLTELAKGDQSSTSLTVSPFFGKPSAGAGIASDVFVIMPFARKLQHVFEDHVVPVCREAGLSCRRGDDLFASGHVMNEVWSALCGCRWVIADCTGRNPNVFYELGIAHTLGKRVILLAQDEEDIPFDIRHVRYLRYADSAAGLEELRLSLRKVLAAEPSASG